ncbi:probable esterase KAI2 [Manihot esculenta]|uniref:AB hydrolase-1 domain-containing protein n=1 Tax=Manihot esculenta TaxID=3983 RepID=A0A2C9UQX6_MANES|nr:probable esterase KAI2 [Manihot esculenta]OAY33660.1 hypothetical protein MANES_13G114500v8 [Manihot esculenta]
MVILQAHNVNVLGSGEQAIVLCHNFGTDQSVWKYLVPYLLEDYRVILYDNMGAGSTNPDYFDFERYSTLDGFAYDLLAILDELEVKSCIFIGHSVLSMAGAIASISRPDLFSKLILICGTPRPLNDKDYHGGFEQADLHQMLEGMRSNFKAWRSGLAPMVVGGDMDSTLVQEISRTLFNMRPDIALSLTQLKFQCDVRHVLPMVKVPCHIVQSAMDMVPAEVSEYMHQHLGGPSVIEIMPTTGHLPHLSSPDIVIPVILRHINLDITK